MLQRVGGSSAVGRGNYYQYVPLSTSEHMDDKEVIKIIHPLQYNKTVIPKQMRLLLVPNISMRKNWKFSM